MTEENKQVEEVVEEITEETEVVEDTAAVVEENSPEAQIAQLQAEKDEMYNKFLRAQADLQNFRTRVNKEKEQMLMYSSQRVIEALLPVVDNFERAIAASEDAESQDAQALAQGVEMVFRQLQQVFEQEGVTTVPGVGSPFDPNMHQAVMQEESSEYESGIIIEEFQKGYKLKDRVIRPSMVKVSS